MVIAGMKSGVPGARGDGPTGRYNVFAELACGGMAMVYLGQLEGEHGFKRSVAIKRMHAQYTRDQEFRDMFLDEARLVARIRHPNVVPTLDIVSREDALLIVMEYVDGESVAQLISLGGAVPARIATAIAQDALCGLHAAHELRGDDGKFLGVIHRDVSPANILVGKDGLSRILDFGVAKAAGRSATTKDGSIKGKVPYMPPEQLWGSVLDRTCDTYALSVCLWEMLTGRRLFRGENEAETMRLVVEGEVQPPSVYVPELAMLDDVVMRGLSRDPTKRFQTALEMARALEKALAPASRLETGEWVETIAHAALARRGELLLQMQRGAMPPAPFEVASLATILTTSTSRTTVGQALSHRSSPAAAAWRQGLAIAAGVLLVLGTIGTSVVMRRQPTASAASRSAVQAPAIPVETMPAQAPAPQAAAPAPSPTTIVQPAPEPRPTARSAGSPPSKAAPQRVSASPAQRPTQAPAPPPSVDDAARATAAAAAPHSDAALGSRY
jgi:serine/threonine-protein kinase